MKLTQCDVILKVMIENRGRKDWTAKDFQSGEHFVGYEASARMSDLIRLYPDLLIVGKEGRFRTLSINWNKVELINEIQERYS